VSHCSLSHSRTILDGSSRMPTDYSGAARAAKLRRISASQGPVPAVRANIGSQALDAQLGGMDCCPAPNPPNPPNPCNPQVYWANSPIQLTLQVISGFEYSALYATVISNVTITPLFGPVTGYTPPNAFITVSVQNSGPSWTIIFTSDRPLTGTLSCLAGFQFACNPVITSSNNLTFTV